MFLLGIRCEPDRAGINATDLGFMLSDEVAASQERNVLELGIDIQSLDAGLARAIAGGAEATEGHVWLTAECAEIDVGDTGLDALGKPHRAIDVASVNGCGETVFGGVRHRQRISQVVNRMQGYDRAKYFFATQFR